MPVPSIVLNALPQAQRLALAYAQGLARERLAGFFALDARLAGIVRNSREPMMAQLRLAWWREQLSGDFSAAQGEPLLELLEFWREDRSLLVDLVDAWEGQTGEAPLASEAFEGLAAGRARVLAAIGGGGFILDQAVRMGRNWALADLSSRLSHPDEQQNVQALAQRQDWTQARLPRSLRPLAMLHDLAARNFLAGKPAHSLSARSALAMMRIGLLTR